MSNMAIWSAAFLLLTAGITHAKEHKCERNENDDCYNELAAQKEIEPECMCKDDETGQWYNLCYHLPVDPTRKGKRFSCRYLKDLKRLRLVDGLNNEYVWIEAGGIPEPAFITAASDNHFYEVQRLIIDFQKVLPERSVIFYDIGLNDANVAKMKKFCNVQYRKFDFSRYPPYLRKLKEYRWKILLIAEALNEFGAVWYMDAAVSVLKPVCSDVYKQLTCRNEHLAKGYPPYWRDIKYIAGQRMYQAIESSCFKFAYLLHSYAGHSIYSATTEGMYDYIPSIKKMLKHKVGPMYKAGLAFAVRTKEVIEDFMRWAVLCALEEKCLVPDGANLFCSFNDGTYDQRVSCHRYDQSLMSLLLTNRHDYNIKPWTSGVENCFSITPGKISKQSPKTCK